MPYSSMLFAADLNSLASRREDISRKFFHNITQSTSCLHHLLPDPNLPSHNSRLRSYKKFPRSRTRTKRYRSFVKYALSHYQDRIYNSWTDPFILFTIPTISITLQQLFESDYISIVLHYSLYCYSISIIHCIFTFICIFICI